MTEQKQLDKETRCNRKERLNITFLLTIAMLATIQFTHTLTGAFLIIILFTVSISAVASWWHRSSILYWSEMAKRIQEATVRIQELKND